MSDKLPEQRGYIITPDCYIAFGNRQSQIGNYPSALAAYERAVKIAPSYARAYNWRGYANELDSTLSEAFYNRGTLKHQELGDPVGALADYDRAIEIDSNLAAAYLVRSLLKQNLLGDLLGASSDYDFPKGTLRERAIASDPPDYL